jgi:hypothetical protein
MGEDGNQAKGDFVEPFNEKDVADIERGKAPMPSTWTEAVSSNGKQADGALAAA